MYNYILILNCKGIKGSQRKSTILRYLEDYKKLYPVTENILQVIDMKSGDYIYDSEEDF